MVLLLLHVYHEQLAVDKESVEQMFLVVFGIGRISHAPRFLTECRMKRLTRGRFCRLL